MKLVATIAISWIVLGIASPSEASDENKRFLSMSATCGEYIENRKQPESLWNPIYKHYIAGWLTSYSILTPNTYDITGGGDLAGIMVWLENYCRDNPLKSLDVGLLMLTEELYPNRIKMGPPKQKP